MKEDFYSEIINGIVSGDIKTKQELHRKKVKLCRKYNLRKVPPDSEIISNIPNWLSDDERDLLVSMLRKKPVRSLSGVTVVAVMTSPEECPHGRCIPCPGGVEKNTPQSYTGYEPAARRAIMNSFDPFKQTRSRLEQLSSVGHPIDKVDLIVMGGTFTARDPEYQRWFVKRCFDGLNNEKSRDLEESKRKNEKTKSRCIGLTIETRPDWLRMQHIDTIIELGTTRVEIGVQTTFDDVLYTMNRGHTTMDSILATKLAKDAGLKICYHMMLGLPGSNRERDIESFRTIFNDQRFMPDMIKIYPTLVIKGTKLYDMWKTGAYKPLESKDAIPLIAEIKTLVPEWVRIQRIERDVPSPQIDAGIKDSNLRQLVQEEMRRQGRRCRCIRCREVGHIKPNGDVKDEDIIMVRRNYRASDGVEIFLSLEDRDLEILYGYLRLRLPSSPHRPELNRERSMIIRELKILGREISIGKQGKMAIQHRGFGRELIEESERICSEEFDCTRLFVLSGVGVKEYYRNLGFEDDGFYLSKKCKH